MQGQPTTFISNYIYSRRIITADEKQIHVHREYIDDTLYLKTLKWLIFIVQGCKTFANGL